jgi:tetratricopeptide (TPR) repeat protein
MSIVTEKVLELINSKSLALFCGAGISYNSGIPTVRPLIEYMFRKFGSLEEHTKAYLDSYFPFEATLEVIAQDTLVKGLLDVFDYINPNANHNLIAYLAKKGLLKVIFTTNFDRNIEVAFEKLGLVYGNDFVVLFENNHFEEFDFRTDIILIIKLHGSMEFMPSITATISGLSNIQNKSLVAKMLGLVFNSNKPKNILFWGYSFSDHFDINPVLNSVDNSGTEVYSIEHDHRCIEDEIRSTGRKGLFKHSNNIKELHCHSDLVVKELYQHLLQEYSQPKNVFNWKEVIDKWYDDVIDNTHRYKHGYIILVHIFLSSGRIEIAKYYIDEAFSKIYQLTQFQRMELHNCLATYYVREGDLKNKAFAVEHYEKALAIAIQIENEYEASIISGNLGMLYVDSDTKKAESLLEASVLHFDGMLKEDGHAFLNTSGRHYCGYKYNLGLCYKRSLQLNKAIQTYEEVIKFARDKGYLEVLEISSYSLGLIFLDQQNVYKAFDCFYEAYNIAKLMSRKHTIVNAFEVTFASLLILKGPAQAESFFNEEINALNLIASYNSTFQQLVFKMVSIKGF